MSFLTEYDALDTPGKAVLLRQWLATKPAELFRELRQNRPILTSPIGTFVTKFRDVVEVLDQHTVFTVKPYEPKMQRVTGPFILGEDDTPLYQRDVSALRLAFRRDDMPALKATVGRIAGGLLQAARPNGRIDVVAGYSRLVPARLVVEYFGTPGPDEPTLMRWARTIFRDIFTNLEDNPQVRDAALASAAEMRPYLDKLAAATREQIENGQAVGDHILGRLLRLRDGGQPLLDLTTVRHNLIGLIVGAIDTTSKACAQVFDHLLANPERLAAAQAATRDDALLAQHVFEALRFNPQNPFLFRLCLASYTIAKGTSRAVLIQPGTLVFAVTSSAMFDSDELDCPDEYRPDRPEYHYLHFGHGLHTCFGRYINAVQLPEMAKQLLLLPKLRRAAGNDGMLQYDGPFPQSMAVEFD
jgi:cytochrome P450